GAHLTCEVLHVLEILAGRTGHRTDVVHGRLEISSGVQDGGAHPDDGCRQTSRQALTGARQFLSGVADTRQVCVEFGCCLINFVEAVSISTDLDDQLLEGGHKSPPRVVWMFAVDSPTERSIQRLSDRLVLLPRLLFTSGPLPLGK